MDDFGPLRRLAGKIKPAGEGTRIRAGVIVSYASGRATVNLGGDTTTDIPDVPCAPPWDGIDYANPDNVLLLFDPPILIVICKL